MNFVAEHFGEGKEKISAEEVLDKLTEMEYDGSDDRLKMALLYFLAAVLKGRSKVGAPIEPFLLRVVDDLHLCETFSWGRFTFEDNMKEIFHVDNHFRGKLSEKPSWTFPGFINPLEILAFESIPALKTEFRAKVEGADAGCPRMCRWKFMETGASGFGLDEIYATLGDTKDISSVLEREGDEMVLMEELMEEDLWCDYELLDDDDDAIDPIVDGWNRFLIRGHGKICWEDIREKDIQSRGGVESVESVELVEPVEPVVPAQIAEAPQHQDLEDIKEAMQVMMNTMEEGFNGIKEVIGRMEIRVRSLEKFRRDFQWKWESYKMSGFQKSPDTQEPKEKAVESDALENATEKPGKKSTDPCDNEAREKSAEEPGEQQPVIEEPGQKAAGESDDSMLTKPVEKVPGDAELVEKDIAEEEAIAAEKAIAELAEKAIADVIFGAETQEDNVVAAEPAFERKVYKSSVKVFTAKRLIKKCMKSRSPRTPKTPRPRRNLKPSHLLQPPYVPK